MVEAGGTDSSGRPVPREPNLMPPRATGPHRPGHTYRKESRSDRVRANNRPVQVRAVIVALGVCLGVAVGGCGASDRESDAAAVAERFHAALEERDGEAACAELSRETASKLEQQEAVPCEEAVLALELPRGGAVAGREVYVRSASVDLVDGGTTFLDEGPRGWKVSAAGCASTAPNQPYACQLEG